MDYFLEDTQKTGHTGQSEEGSRKAWPFVFSPARISDHKDAFLLLLRWEEGKKGVESCLCIRYLVFQVDLSGFVDYIAEILPTQRWTPGPSHPTKKGKHSLSSHLKQPCVCFSFDLEGKKLSKHTSYYFHSPSFCIIYSGHYHHLPRES